MRRLHVASRLAFHAWDGVWSGSIRSMWYIDLLRTSCRFVLSALSFDFGYYFIISSRRMKAWPLTEWSYLELEPWRMDEAVCCQNRWKRDLQGLHLVACESIVQSIIVKFSRINQQNKSLPTKFTDEPPITSLHCFWFVKVVVLNDSSQPLPLSFIRAKKINTQSLFSLPFFLLLTRYSAGSLVFSSSGR